MKENFALELLMKNKLIAIEFELAQQAIQGRFFIPGRSEVGNGMQTGFVEAVISKIVGVQSTNSGMFFQDKGAGSKSGKSDGGGYS